MRKGAILHCGYAQRPVRIRKGGEMPHEVRSRRSPTKLHSAILATFTPKAQALIPSIVPLENCYRARHSALIQSCGGQASSLDSYRELCVWRHPVYNARGIYFAECIASQLKLDQRHLHASDRSVLFA